MKEKIVASLIVTVVVCSLGWGLSVEMRIGDVSTRGRLERLEDALVPVLVDYEVRRQLSQREEPLTIEGLDRAEEAARARVDEFITEQRSAGGK